MGAIEIEEHGATVRLNGRFRNIDYHSRRTNKRTPRVRNVRLEEIAEVQRDLEKETSRAFFSWKGAPYEPSVEISVKKIPGADTVSVIENVLEELRIARAAEDWPFGLEYRVTQDQSEQIWNSLTDVFNNGWQAMLFVFAVLFLFLSWREGVLAGLAIPLTCRAKSAKSLVMTTPTNCAARSGPHGTPSTAAPD
jgi:multidrug efflux pump subunit AcrB